MFTCLFVCVLQCGKNGNTMLGWLWFCNFRDDHRRLISASLLVVSIQCWDVQVHLSYFTKSIRFSSTNVNQNLISILFFIPWLDVADCFFFWNIWNAYDLCVYWIQSIDWTIAQFSVEYYTPCNPGSTLNVFTTTERSISKWASISTTLSLQPTPKYIVLIVGIIMVKLHIAKIPHIRFTKSQKTISKSQHDTSSVAGAKKNRQIVCINRSCTTPMDLKIFIKRWFVIFLSTEFCRKIKIGRRQSRGNGGERERKMQSANNLYSANRTNAYNRIGHEISYRIVYNPRDLNSHLICPIQNFTWDITSRTHTHGIKCTPYACMCVVCLHNKYTHS